MYHTIEFLGDCLLDLETSPRDRLQRTLINRGDRLEAQLKPYVVETDDGPVEVADLFLADGTATRAVRCECFCFAE